MSAAERFKPNPLREEARRKIRSFLAGQNDGARIGWVDFEKGTGVSMAVVGGERDLVRDVLDATRRPYLAIVGYGIELSCADNAVAIVDKRVEHIRRGFAAAAETSGTVLEKHGDQLESSARMKIEAVSATMATIRALVGKRGDSLPAKT